MKRTTFHFFVLTLALLFLGQRWANGDSRLADDPRVKDALQLLEIWVDAEIAYERIPGGSMAVTYDQDLIWSRGWGSSDLETGKPSETDTIYSICSISKLFTSIAVMQLRDEGKLRLDDPVEKHLPWFDIQKTFPESPPITIESLLTHSAGLPRESAHSYWTGPDFPFPTREQIIEELSNQETLYPAETYFQYSNLGLTLAGEIVSAASGRPYNEYVQAKILEPLGLRATTPYLPEEQRGDRFATGYGFFPREGNRTEVPSFQARGIGPAAGYASTAVDLAKFASWQFHLLEEGGTNVLSANTLREMHRVHWVDPDWKTTWGIGFGIWRNKDHTYVGHGGSCPGFRSQLSISPKDKIAATFMTNAMGVNTRMFTQMTHDILSPAVAKALESPGEGKTAPPELEKYAGLYRSFWGESAVLTWEGDLAVVDTPTRDPLESLTKLKHIEGSVFRRIRDDDEELGEEWVFELDAQGRVLRMKQHGNFSEKVR